MHWEDIHLLTTFLLIQRHVQELAQAGAIKELSTFHSSNKTNLNRQETRELTYTGRVHSAKIEAAEGWENHVPLIRTVDAG